MRLARSSSPTVTPTGKSHDARLSRLAISHASVRLIPFAIFIGFFIPIPFWLASRFGKPGSLIKRTGDFVHTSVILLYIGYLPYSVNGQWWSCFVIGLASQWWARKYRPKWFKKYNYLTSAALDGGSQVIIFILVSRAEHMFCRMHVLTSASELRCIRCKREGRRLPLLVGQPRPGRPFRRPLRAYIERCMACISCLRFVFHCTFTGGFIMLDVILRALHQPP